MEGKKKENGQKITPPQVKGTFPLRNSGHIQFLQLVGFIALYCRSPAPALIRSSKKETILLGA